jgi:hypothetical protein
MRHHVRNISLDRLLVYSCTRRICSININHNRILANLVFSPEYLSTRTESTTITNRFRLCTDLHGFDLQQPEPVGTNTNDDYGSEGSTSIYRGFKPKPAGIRIIIFRVTTRLQSKSNRCIWHTTLVIWLLTRPGSSNSSKFPLWLALNNFA